MADDVNALIHKPAQQPPDKPERLPTEADFEAIVATMAQTTRGRWFLAEYARRNRNADTRMVLDAVARIETSLMQPPQVPQVQVVDSGPAVAAAIAQARRRAAELADAGRASREIVQQHVKALRELTWTLREWGTDNAICDRLDAHAGAILETPLAPDAAALLAIFDDIRRGSPVAVAIAQPPAPVRPAAEEIPPPANVEAAVAALKVRTPDAPRPETLGTALLTQGLVSAPRDPDALAPLRRMTQAEKVALFT